MMRIRKGMKGWLSLFEVAERLHVSHEAARQLVCRGTLPARRRRDETRGGNQRIEVPLFAVVELMNDPGFGRRRRGGKN